MSAWLTPLTDLQDAGPALALLPAAYLAGSIPFGLILALMLGKTDVRDKGSGNIGATNVARVVGKKLGIVTLFLDAFKGAAPVLVALYVIPMPAHLAGSRTTLAALLGLLAFLGHCFPIWLRFRGGKGVATGAGVMLAYLPPVAGIGLLAFALTFLFAKKVSLGSLVGAAAVVVALPFFSPVDVALVVIFTMFFLLVLRHTSNIKRLLKKEELKV